MLIVKVPPFCKGGTFVINVCYVAATWLGLETGQSRQAAFDYGFLRLTVAFAGGDNGAYD